MGLLLLLGVCLFVQCLFCSLLAGRYLDKRRARRLAGMLQGAPKAPLVTTSLLKDSAESSPLERLLKSVNLIGTTEQILQQAAVPWSAARLFRRMAVLAVVGMAFGIVFPVISGVLISCLVFGGGFGSLPWLYVRRRRKKRMAALEKQLPDAMDFLARSMRAGYAF